LHHREYPSNQYGQKKQYPDSGRARRSKKYQATHKGTSDYTKAETARKMVERRLDGQSLICSIDGCGRSAQAHHESYDKPLKIVPLCPHHHRELHAGRIERMGLVEIDLE
jgi:hypothetical protein